MADNKEYIDALKEALPQSIDFGRIYNLIPPEEWEKDSRGAAMKAFIKADVFDARYYLEKYGDLEEAGIDPLWHYLNFGVFENRTIVPETGESHIEHDVAHEISTSASAFDQDGEDSISVLIPAYKVEPFLERAVNSILKQSHKNLQIIIYDDASTDGTRKVGAKLAQNFPNISLLWGDENRGESYGRNKCIAAAQGRYITFVDGDDYYIDENFLDAMIETSRKDGADVVISPYRRYRKGRKAWTDECITGRFSGREAAQIFINRGFGSHGCASKLYRTSIAKQIHVNEFGYSEDVPFVLEALMRSRKVAVNPNPGYMYDLNSISSWRPSSPTPLHYYSSLRALFEIIIMCWEAKLDLAPYIEIWTAEHKIRIIEFITNPSNLHATYEISGYFREFQQLIEQLVPELGQFFSLGGRNAETGTRFLPIRYKKYVNELQGRMRRFLDTQPVNAGNNFVIWVQHLKNGGLERVAAQLGNSLADNARIYYILDEEKEYDFDYSGSLLKADLLNPEIHSLLRDATAIFDFHWKSPGFNFPILNYIIHNYRHKYIPTVHSSWQCDAYFDAVEKSLQGIGETEGALQAIICVSNEVREELEKKYGALSRVAVVNNPLEIEECKRAKSLKNGFKYVLFAGRLNAQRPKSLDLLIQAWRNSRAHKRDIRLMLVGSGQLRELERIY